MECLIYRMLSFFSAGAAIGTFISGDILFGLVWSMGCILWFSNSIKCEDLK